MCSFLIFFDKIHGNHTDTLNMFGLYIVFLGKAKSTGPSRPHSHSIQYEKVYNLK